MSTVSARRGRRTEDFRVRTWLQIGAASAGLGAAMWGMSLVGAGVALADDAGSAGASSSGASSSASSSSSAGPSSKGGAAKSAVSGPKKSAGSSAASAKGATSAKDTKDTLGTTDTKPAKSKPATPAAAKASDAGTPDDDAAGTTSTPQTPSTPTPTPSATVKGANDSDETDAPSVEPRPDSGQHEPEVRAETASLTTVPQSASAAAPGQAAAVSQAAVDDPWAVEHTVGAPNLWQLNTSAQIAAFTSGVQATIDALPLPPELRHALSGTLWTLRRGLFNLAPTVGGPVQVFGEGGPIAGNVGAVDPEGDAIVYGVVQGPTKGTVVVHADGSYTYTPGEGFDGVDSFVISATDVGLHVNLVDWFRTPATVGMLLNQNAITFDFTYASGSEYWEADAARKAALVAAAKSLAGYFLVTEAVSLRYDVIGTNDPNSGTLASAGSARVSTAPGFWPTIVQNKLFGGEVEGAPTDGTIRWNWGVNWGLGSVVGADEFDFKAVAMHELVHSFGWLVGPLGEPGTNEDISSWAAYAEYLTTADGRSPFDADYTWNTDFDDNLLGANGGLYFSGPAAMAAYGGRVPLYTPAEWEQGSSVNHLDDATFANGAEKMMNAATETGPSPRTLSAVELGVLADLGYHVVYR